MVARLIYRKCNMRIVARLFELHSTAYWAKYLRTQGGAIIRPGKHNASKWRSLYDAA
jgi:hypothetical protein